MGQRTEVLAGGVQKSYRLGIQVIMKMKRAIGRVLIVFLVCLTVPFGYAASLDEKDLATPGDGLITLDTVSGLEWLDLDQAFGLSFNEVMSGAGGWTALGFRVANADEIISLFQNAGFDTTNISAIPLTNAQAQSFFDLFSVTSTNFPGLNLLSSGFFEVDANNVAFAAVNTADVNVESSLAGFASGVFSKDFHPAFGGSWLVRTNSPPVALAGSDQSIRAGETVLLDGTSSYDDNTPTVSLGYAWSFFLVPPGSSASLSAADTATPSFIADLLGDYIVELVVTDERGLSSPPDQVTIGTSNLAPTADAGSDQLVIVGATVNLSAAGSSDPESDPLSYQWTLDQVPTGSVAALSGGTTGTPSFVADLQGAYTATVSVADPIGAGTPDAVGIVATTAEGYAEFEIVQTNTLVMALTSAQVTTSGNQEAFSNFLGQAVRFILSGNVSSAIDKLQMALSRTDGCVLRGAPDRNGPGRDWITDCGEQQIVYESLDAALIALMP